MIETHEITVFADGSIDGLFSVRQFDNLSHNLIFKLQENLSSGDAAQLRVRPNGKEIPYLYPCTISGDRIIVTPNNAAWESAGVSLCQLEITSSGDVIWQTNAFPVRVIHSIDKAGGITPEKGQTLIDDLNNARDEALAAADAANKAAEEAKGITILGTYASLELLRQSITDPLQGDHYNVGTSAPYTVYMWDETEPPGDWIDQGQMEGPQGEIGPQGPQGEPGATGEQGPQGPQGETGATGEQGPQGEQGPHYTPSVSPEGDLSWTNNGGLENPTTVNIKGPQGEPGPKGDQGPAGTGLDILGTYNTLEELRANIIVPNQGDMYNVGTAAPYTIYMWDETEPPGDWISQGQLQGAQGPAGPEGPQGPEGAQGPKGETGATGERGPEGKQGPAGPQGPNAVTAETSTTFNGLLKGNGATVEQAAAGIDYQAPTIGTEANKAVYTGEGGALQAGTLPVSAGGTGATTSAGALANLGAQAAPSKVTCSDATTSITLADNTKYTVQNTVTALNITVPTDTQFECWISLTTGASIAVEITPTYSVIGEMPTFEPNSQYEISVKNGVFVVGTVTAA